MPTYPINKPSSEMLIIALVRVHHYASIRKLQTAAEVLGNRSLKLGSVLGQERFCVKGKRTHQEGTQKCHGHHQTRKRGNLRECSVEDVVDVVDGIVIIIVIIVIIVITVIIVIVIIIITTCISIGLGVISTTFRRTGCVAGTGVTNRATIGVVRAFHICSVRAS